MKFNGSSSSHVQAIILMLSIITFSLFEPFAFNIYFQAWMAHASAISPFHLIRNLEIFHNYTMLKENNYYLRAVITRNAGKYDVGNYMDKYSLGLQEAIHYHFRDVDITRDGFNCHGYFVEPNRKFAYWGKPGPKNHSFIQYDKVIAGFSYHSQFGHFLQDMICGIISLPSEYFKDAEIFVNFGEKQAKNFFKFIGFDPDHVHSFTNEWIYVKDLHLVVSDFGINSLFASWIDLHNIIYKKYNYSSIKPTLYTIINKPKGNWGCVLNLEELVNYTKLTYPQYDWREYPPDTLLDLEGVSRLLASSKVYVSAPGSSCFNVIYMQPNSVVAFFSRKKPDNPAIAAAFSLGVFIFSINNNEIHEDVKNISLDSFKVAISEVVYVAENGKWRNDIEKRARFLFDSSIYDSAKNFKLFKRKTSEYKRVKKFGDYHLKVMSQYPNPYFAIADKCFGAKKILYGLK
ncbi:hypothetical protein TVAG_140530 [Trichomonas vaginalis G3]|uniref:Glycosyltransferase 61 catalytic domain-containing protein n=1 Tax=Trichomonas vaginalis (strain ATCC PRA-98 / G3) TaxID=412133 RepID=A2EJU1_TRIV3|nr:glycosyltransferase family [Trichomonas vaginalis G3]EAY07079.1 hypothetical protein TVAG_140530 [Trichomonas vaginalis G3]KAI5535250.1 glycosyltransferase family [Trichomonas vaginalis G3]|eukprot:XP_001319302.1 hypothetical protein [Trichomonas vaginalis G3]